MSRWSRFVKAGARYLYWKVGAADGDPGLDRMRAEVMREAEKLLKKTSQSLAEAFAKEAPKPRSSEEFH